MGDTNKAQHTRRQRLQEPYLLGRELHRLQVRHVANYPRDVEHAIEAAERHWRRPQSVPQSTASADTLSNRIAAG